MKRNTVHYATQYIEKQHTLILMSFGAICFTSLNSRSPNPSKSAITSPC